MSKERIQGLKTDPLKSVKGVDYTNSTNRLIVPNRATLCLLGDPRFQRQRRISATHLLGDIFELLRNALCDDALPCSSLILAKPATVYSVKKVTISTIVHIFQRTQCILELTGAHIYTAQIISRSKQVVFHRRQCNAPQL